MISYIVASAILLPLLPFFLKKEIYIKNTYIDEYTHTYTYIKADKKKGNFGYPIGIQWSLRL
jgi:hypothetical protein